MGGRIKIKNRDNPFFKSFSFLSHLWQEGGDAQKKEETSPNSFSSLGHLCQEGDDAKKGEEPSYNSFSSIGPLWHEGSEAQQNITVGKTWQNQKFCQIKVQDRPTLPGRNSYYFAYV